MSPQISGSSGGPEIAMEAHFNYPVVGEDGELRSDGNLDRVVARTIDAAQPGSEIHVAVFAFWKRQGKKHHPVFKALLKAADRGVKVQVIVGAEGDDGPHVTALRDGAGLLKGLGSENVRACYKSCITRRDDRGGATMHNKFYLFSRAGESKHVVIQSSANLTTWNRRAYNNEVVIRNDEALYRGYVTYWEHLFAKKNEVTDYNQAFGQTDFRGASGVRMYRFPRSEEQNPIVRVVASSPIGALDRVSCPGTEIRVAMSQFNDTEVLKKLLQMGEAGCDVRLIADVNQKSKYELIWNPELRRRHCEGVLQARSLYSLSAYPESRYPRYYDCWPEWECDSMLEMLDRVKGQALEVRYTCVPVSHRRRSRRETCADFGGISPPLHSKYLLLSGIVDGRPNQKIVFTGSYNFMPYSLAHGEEVMLEIPDASIHNQFNANFDLIWASLQ